MENHNQDVDDLYEVLGLRIYNNICHLDDIVAERWFEVVLLDHVLDCVRSLNSQSPIVLTFECHELAKIGEKPPHLIFVLDLPEKILSVICIEGDEGQNNDFVLDFEELTLMLDYKPFQIFHNIFSIWYYVC